MASIVPVANALRNPGELVDNIYFSESSLQQTAARVLNKESYSYPFNSLSLGSTNTLIIQKNLMASHVLVVFEFDPFITPWTAGWALENGWGFKMIDRIQLQYGGSEVIDIDGHDNFMRAMNECENNYKKESVIKLAGIPSWIDGAGGKVGPLPGNTAGAKFRAVVPIILPHSSVNAYRQMPFDVACLNQSVNIRLTLKSPFDVWTNPQSRSQEGTTPLGQLSQAQTTLSNAYWVVGQQVLIDTIASKKDLVSGMSPDSNYSLSYFWKYPQHGENLFTIPGVANNTFSQTISAPISATLTGFRNGALDSLVLFVEKIGPTNVHLSDTQAAQINVPRAGGLNLIPMMNISVQYAGQVIYQSASTELSQALDNMINVVDSSYPITPIVAGGALATPAAGGTYRPQYVRIQLAQFSECMSIKAFVQAAGALMSHDTLQITFQIFDNFNYAVADAGLNLQNQYRLNVQQLYSSALTIERGSARFAFVNPLGQPQIPFNV